MRLSLTELQQRLEAAFEAQQVHVERAFGELTMTVPVEYWLEVARGLRDREELAFEQLIDLCGVDYLGYGEAEWAVEDVTSEGFSRAVDGEAVGRFDWEHRPEAEVDNRFAVVAHLLSVTHNVRLRIRTFAQANGLPLVPSLVGIWNSANWFEREAFDLYGIAFEGHPDLRRILTDYGFVGHPMRKDFPLIGNVEVRYDEELGRVVYQPVSIEPRVGVAKTVREDSRYLSPEQAVQENKHG